ncbi:MAG: ADP-ribosylglycohydrolase family protein [Firmicutes bacterium]|nr:ADP-ribosylglycohydrolase family protein [Bacillota bacterium]
MGCVSAERLSRAEGALWGECAGDALGSVVEFLSAADVRAAFPEGLRDLIASPVHGTQAGQPTDDSELAFALADSLIIRGPEGYHPETAASQYLSWWTSNPFDCGHTIAQAVTAMADAARRGESLARAAGRQAKAESQANGALMRHVSLGIWGWDLPEDHLLAAVREDTCLTHPHRVCQEASTAFALAVAGSIREGWDGEAAWRAALGWHRRSGEEYAVRSCLEQAVVRPPDTFGGWVLNALQNAFYQATHAPTLLAGIEATVMQGADADTNACVAGALLGAIHGHTAIPASWRDVMTSCRPDRDSPRARPPVYWPRRVPDLARDLLQAGEAVASARHA